MSNKIKDFNFNNKLSKGNGNNLINSVKKIQSTPFDFYESFQFKTQCFSSENITYIDTSKFDSLSDDELKNQLIELEKRSNFNSLKGLDNSQVEADIKTIRKLYEDRGNQIVSIKTLDEKISNIDNDIKTYISNNEKVRAEDLKKKKKSYEFLKSVINKTNKTYYSYEELINDISTDVLTTCYNNNDLIFNEELFKEKYSGYEITEFYNLLNDYPSATDDPLLLFKSQKYVYGNNIEIINNEFNEKKKYLQAEYLSIDSESVDMSKSNFMMLALLSEIDSSYNDISLQELDDVTYTVNDDYKNILSQFQQYIPFLSDDEIKQIFSLSKKDSQSVYDYIFTELKVTERVDRGTNVFAETESRMKLIQRLVANDFEEKFNYVFPEEIYKENYQHYSIAMQTEFQIENNYNLQMLQDDDFSIYLKSEDVENILNKEHKKIENIDKYAENYDKIAYYLTDDEKKVYYYRLKKYGEDNAKKYLLFLKNTVRMRAGKEEAEKRLEIFKTGEDEQGNPMYDFSKYYDVGSTAILTAMGFGDGVENFFVGIKNCFYADKEQTCFDYEKMFIMEALSSDKKEGEIFSKELAYEFGSSMGNMAPVIITSMALQAVPFIGQTAVPGLISTIGMGASSFGNNKHDLYVQGYDGYKLYMRAMVGAMSEVALEKFLGTIPGISIVNKTAEAASIGANKDLVKFLKYILLNSAKEGIEESSQVVVDSIMNSILLGNDFSIDFEELVKSGILGALSGGITNATTIGVSKIPININGIKCSLETSIINKLGITDNRLLDSHYKTALAEILPLCDENTRTSESLKKAINIMEKAGFKDVADNIRTIDLKQDVKNSSSIVENNNKNTSNTNETLKVNDNINSENIEVLEIKDNVENNRNNDIDIKNFDSNKIADFLANTKYQEVQEVVVGMTDVEINDMVSKIPLTSYYDFYKKLGSSDIFTKLTPENLNRALILLKFSPNTFKLMSMNDNFIEAIAKSSKENIDIIMETSGIDDLQIKIKEKIKSISDSNKIVDSELELPKLDESIEQSNSESRNHVVKFNNLYDFNLNSIEKISNIDFNSENELKESCNLSELFDESKQVKRIKVGNYELQLTNTELIDVWLNKNLKYEALDSDGKVKDFGALMYYLKRYFESNYDIALKEDFYDSSFESLKNEYINLLEMVRKVSEKDASVTNEILNVVANRGNDYGSINANDINFRFNLQQMNEVVNLMKNLDNFNNSNFLSEMSYKNKILLFKFMNSGVINTYLNITTGELNAVDLYQSGKFREFNEYLDTNKDITDFDMKKIDNFLSMLMDKSLLKESTILQRATTVKEFGAIPITEIEGKIISQNRYKSSCIDNYDTIGTKRGGSNVCADTDSIPVKIDYVCPEGTKCINLGMIQALSIVGTDVEHEALIGKKQKIRYDKVKQIVDENGKISYAVLATIIPDGVDENISIKDIVDSNTYDIIKKQYGIDENSQINKNVNLENVEVLELNENSNNITDDEIMEKTADDLSNVVKKVKEELVKNQNNNINIKNFDSNKIADFLLNTDYNIVNETITSMTDIEINDMVSKIPLTSYYDFYKKLGSSDIFTKLTPENLYRALILLKFSPKTFNLMSMNDNFIEAIAKSSKENFDIIMETSGINDLQVKIKEKMKSITSNVEVLELNENSNNITDDEIMEKTADDLSNVVKKVKEELVRDENNNQSDLRNEIFSKMPDNLTDVEKIRFLYIELCKKVNYDEKYFSASDKNYNSYIYNNKLFLDSFNSSKVICKGWSELFSQLLIEAGISEKNIKIVGNDYQGSHKWVEINIGNGKRIFADATQPYNHSTDLMNCKIGNKTGGFYIINDNVITNVKSFTSRECFDNIRFNVSKVADSLNNVDYNIGYSYQGKYYSDLLPSINKFFSGLSISSNVSMISFENIHEILLKNTLSMGSLEIFSYLRFLKESLFSQYNTQIIHVINDKYKGRVYLKLIDSNDNFQYFYFSGEGDCVLMTQEKFDNQYNSEKYIKENVDK